MCYNGVMVGIQLKNISKSYGAKSILAHVDLEIPKGEFVMMRGKSGAGKSTLLNIIGGIEQPTSGEILIGEQNISQLRAKERAEFYRHAVGFVFQGFYLQPQLTLRDNIALPGIFANMPKNERMERVDVLAQTLQITEVLDQKPAEVSGGQAERACVARALFMNPQIVLADEPTNNLDPENARNVVDILYKVWKETGATVIVASHDAIVEKYATVVVEVADGGARLMRGGAKDEN